MITRSNTLLILMVSIVASGAWTLKAPPTHGCAGAGPSSIPINIFYNTTTTFAAPSIKLVAPGGVLRFHLAGPPGVDFTVLGDPPSHTWLKGSGNTSTTRHFFVCVPTTVRKDDEFKYTVTTSISPVLDPVVRIL